jgi:demethylmenaquinone methyltransferase/2-methoxy-6-polyprenyl-1,4-benzoquinol methylase
LTVRDGIEQYYARRATEYERIYTRPERQADLATLRDLVEAFARGKRVLEVACGTGYWSEVLARSAESVVATDVGDAVLELARARPLPPGRVVFRCADAFSLEGVAGVCDAAFAGFWWSHVPRARMPRFLQGLRGLLGAEASLLFIDNRYVEGNSTPLCRADTEGNTYQRRVLEDGTAYEVLKNFPSPADVRRDLAAAGVQAADVGQLEYYWYVRA